MSRGLSSSPTVRGRLRVAVLQGRRETVYKMLAKKHDGIVPCFVCGKPVAKELATLEHIIERRNGGTDDMDNLSISHRRCNNDRDRIEAEREKTIEREAA